MRLEITEYDPASEPDRTVVWTDSEGDQWSFVGDEWGYGRPGRLRVPAGHWAYMCDVKIGCLPWEAEVPDSEFVVKDSGVREEYANGFVRDTEDGKEDFVRLFMDPKIHAAITKEPRLLDFLATDGAHLVPPEMLIRWAVHMHKGAQKYGEANWRQARGLVAIARFARSFCRHSVKWLRGDRDEDHAVAIMFNVSARELTPEDEPEAS